MWYDKFMAFNIHAGTCLAPGTDGEGVREVGGGEQTEDRVR